MPEVVTRTARWGGPGEARRLALAFLAILVWTPAGRPAPSARPVPETPAADGTPPPVIVLQGRPPDEPPAWSRRARLELLARALVAPRLAERRATPPAVAGVGAAGIDARELGAIPFLEVSVGERLPGPGLEALRAARDHGDRGMVDHGVVILLGVWASGPARGTRWRALLIRLDDGVVTGAPCGRAPPDGGASRGDGPDRGIVGLAEGFSFESDVLAVGQAIARVEEREISALEVAIADLEAYRLGGEPMRAESGARGLVIRRRDSHHAARILAQCLEARGESERAIEAWRRAVERAPPLERGFVQLGLAACLEDDLQPLEARTAYERAVELVHGDPSLEVEARAGVERLGVASQMEARRREAWARATRSVEDLAARERAARARAAQRIEVARRATEERPREVEPWIRHGELLLADRLVTAAVHSFGQALQLDPGSPAAREGLARGRMLQGDFDEATLVLLGATSLPRRPSALVLLGDALMARTESGWRPERWSEYATSLGSLDHRSYLRIERPAAGATERESDGAVRFWAEAGRRYREAALLAPPDSRAQARFLDWRLLDGESLPAAGSFLRAFEGPEAYSDLLRVEACRLERAGRGAEAVRVMDRFLARAARSPGDVLRVSRRWLSRGSEAASGARTLLDQALVRHPAHAGLRAELARVQMGSGGLEAAIEGFRFALAAGEPAWSALVDAWGRAPVGPRSGRPPMVSPLVSRRATAGGAPRSLLDFIELRGELARALLALDRPGAALAELRPLEPFVRHEERRLAGTRTRRAGVPSRPGGGQELPWTRPASLREEPVDFGNDRERRLWAGYRLLKAHCLRRLDRPGRAGRGYAWAARCLAVREGAVLPEGAWARDLEPASRRMAAEAIAGLGLLKWRAGDRAAARGLEAWARDLDPGGVVVGELGRHIENE